MHFAQKHDTIWSTGINGKVNESLLKFQQMGVRVVRGPLTRKFLLDRDFEVPEVYGDPGLLLPLFFGKEVLMRGHERRECIAILHMNEDYS